MERIERVHIHECSYIIHYRDGIRLIVMKPYLESCYRIHHRGASTVVPTHSLNKVPRFDLGSTVAAIRSYNFETDDAGR